MLQTRKSLINRQESVSLSSWMPFSPIINPLPPRGSSWLISIVQGIEWVDKKSRNKETAATVAYQLYWQAPLFIKTIVHLQLSVPRYLPSRLFCCSVCLFNSSIGHCGIAYQNSSASCPVQFRSDQYNQSDKNDDGRNGNRLIVECDI